MAPTPTPPPPPSSNASTATSVMGSPEMDGSSFEELMKERARVGTELWRHNDDRESFCWDHDSLTHNLVPF